MSNLITVPIGEQLDFYSYYRWCEEHCHGKFYTGTDWDLSVWQPRQQNRIVQFEFSEDAVLFALRWS